MAQPVGFAQLHVQSSTSSSQTLLGARGIPQGGWLLTDLCCAAAFYPKKPLERL